MVRARMALDTSFLSPVRARVRVMTGSAPECVACGALAGAHGQLLDVARNLYRRIFRRPHEIGHVIAEFHACAKLREPSSRAFDPRLASQMALHADRIARIRRQFRRIRHRRRARIPRMLAAGAMTALAGNAVVEKRRIVVTVLRAIDWTQPAGVAGETSRIDRPAEPNLSVLLIAGGSVPGLLLPVPRDGQLTPIPVSRKLVKFA